MPTDADIGNMALSRLGTQATIADLTEASTEARVLNTHYATVRDTLLRARNWNFARITQALSLSGTAPARWTYSYAYPSDCLRLLRLDMGAVSWDARDPLLGFELGSDGSNRFIWTDHAEALAVFTQRVTDPNRFDPEFTVAFVDSLAAAIAYPITQKSEVAQRLAGRAAQSLSEAASESANEDAMQGRGGGWADWEADAIVARS